LRTSRQVQGLPPILHLPSGAQRRRGPLNSNVRPHLSYAFEVCGHGRRRLRICALLHASLALRVSTIQGSYASTAFMRSISSFRRLCAFVFMFGAQNECLAQEYRLSAPLTRAEWQPGEWNGKHEFPGVYCLTFPNPNETVGITTAAFNSNAIFYTGVSYSKTMIASIVVSTMPASRSAVDEHSRQLARERMVQQAFGGGYEVMELDTAFGNTVGIRSRGEAPLAQGAPFPLVKAKLVPSAAVTQTLAVHRIFSRPPVRFEVSVMRMLLSTPDSVEESEMLSSLSSLVDELVVRTFECTSAMPRAANKL
jgi:hypothetical protein